MAEVVGHCGLASDRCGWEELLVPGFDDLEEAGRTLLLGPGWERKWTAHWKYGDGAAACPVRDLAAMPLRGARPVRRFSWSTSQRHRPGLQYMVSTGRHHGFESHAEQELLLALDFAGNLDDVLSQPFRLEFTAAGGTGRHTPDFLAVTRDGVWLIDVRPGARIGDEDRVRFAAAAEAALACGWRYAVAAGWLPNVQATLDTVSAQRRAVTDPLHLQPVLLAAAEGGPVRFGDLVEHGGIPAAARAQALHLIWERRLGAVIYAGAEIGEETAVGHRTLLRSFVTVGCETQLGHNLTIERATRIGSLVRCSPGSHITSSCVLADRVFLGAGVRTVNDKEMTWRDPGGREPELVPPVFGTGARVGSGSVVLAGVNIGEHALVGAGSVVTRDIPAGAVAFGNPARVRGTTREAAS